MKLLISTTVHYLLQKKPLNKFAFSLKSVTISYATLNGGMNGILVPFTTVSQNEPICIEDQFGNH